MSSEFQRPMPALTPAQRYHLDVNGYVVIPNTLTSDEVGTLRDALQKLKRDLLATGDPTARIRGGWFLTNKPNHHYMGLAAESDPSITAYVTNPRLVGMSEELLGSEARICEINAHINSRDPVYKPGDKPQYGFHRGTDIPFGSYQFEGLYHCNFVKTLTNLTDLGPDDGGTVCIAGSHKVDVPVQDMIGCATEDPKLIHQVIAPAGSTLLFAETLIHGTGQVRSDNERIIMICGYAARIFPYWGGSVMTDEFKERIPDSLKTLFHGRAHWTRGERSRKLSDPVDTRPASPVDWPGR